MAGPPAETPALAEELAAPFLILHLPPQIHLFANGDFSRTRDTPIWQIGSVQSHGIFHSVQCKKPTSSITGFRTKEQHAKGFGSKFTRVTSFHHHFPIR